ncbi:Transmembrane emp24 domain-containing protein 1, partial [Globisporangium splendens]
MLLATALSVAQSTDDGVMLQPTYEDDNGNADDTPQEMVAEDPNFDPYQENENVAPLIPAAAIANEAPQHSEHTTYEPKNRKVEVFDFDPSEGLTFYVGAGERECFFQDAKFTGDEISGAYVVSSADSHIDLEVKNPEGATIYRRLGDAEGQYEVHPSIVGVHELCFINADSDGKLVTHVTNTLKSQHPVEREHVSVLAKYASHLDIRLGELESEQRLHQIRTERHIKVEESTSKRVSFYGTLECVVYLLICFFQVYYIKSLLDNPSKVRSWV